MSNQMMQAPQTIKPAGKPPRPVRLPVFFAFVAAGIILVIVELFLFPNLASNPGFLALAIFTTLFSFSSMGLTFSGLRPGLPKAVKWAVAIGLWGFVALDIIFLVLPSFISGPAANDQAVTFVGSSATSATTAPAVAPAISTAPTKATDGAAIAVTAPVSGTFNNAGAEPVAGKATIGKTADSKTVLRLENFTSANGPDLYIYLSKVGSPTTDVQVKNGVEVGKLKATKGDQNYDLDSSIDLSQYKSVVVFCKSFSVVFGYANLGGAENATAMTTAAAMQATATNVTTAAPATTAVVATTVAAKANIPLSGTFNNAGAEPVAGKATLGKTADGKYVLRFEGLNSANGPDLVVYLSKSTDPSKPAEVQSGLEVAKLKSTKGDQNYELPTNFDPSQYKSVVVYCKSFSVIFGYANLN